MILSSSPDIEWQNSKIIIIKSVNSVAELFNELFHKLPLPSYFGFNWNALDECLNDLHWIKEKRILIYHEGKLNIPKKDLELYLDVLKFAVNSWIKNNTHELIVFIPNEIEMGIWVDTIIQNKPRQGWDEAFKKAIVNGDEPDNDMFEA